MEGGKQLDGEWEKKQEKGIFFGIENVAFTRLRFRENVRKNGSKKNGGVPENWGDGGEPANIPREARNKEGFFGLKN